MSTIAEVHGRQILDSRGNPTVEVDVFPDTVGQVLVELPKQPGVNTPDPGLPPKGSVYQKAYPFKYPGFGHDG